MQHTNQLIHSQSPYLLQHAHNPVNWCMWSDEILEQAKLENKPILVSIGYSSCHWCHVMERESFEDEQTAAIMNKHFINIKIDREERPDLDHIYMDAVQAMTGSGGWPLNVFLTPDLKPFYGGTYFPPKAAHGRMSWTDTLLAVSKAFIERGDEIEFQANKLTEHIANSNSFATKLKKEVLDLSDEIPNAIADNILKNADLVWGGFGNAPKFPQSFSIQYLLRQYYHSKNEKYLNQATLSLDKMIMGGIYDQIGGGFARYSTDEKWFAPHFEKMLYDNALLVSVLSEAYQLTQKTIYKETIEQTLSFIEREMMSEDGGFYSALDADTEGVEGKFYTWSKKDIEYFLQTDAELFCEIFNVFDDGNWEHTNILWLQKPLETIATEKSIEINALKNKVIEWQVLLLKKRENRKRPLLDDKCLCSWNALMNIAYSKAYAATGNDHYKTVAEKNMIFIKNNFFENNKLMHCYKAKPYNAAFLDDFAYLTDALIHLQEITGNHEYLFLSKKLIDEVIEQFSEVNNVFFNYTSVNHKNIIAQKVEVYDGATPSANAILCKCLQYLSLVYDDHKMRNRYQQMLQTLQKAIINYPTSFGVWANVIQNEIMGLSEIVISNADVITTKEFLKEYIPNKLFVQSYYIHHTDLPILKDKTNNTSTTFYVCKNQMCLQPQTSLANFLLFFNK